MIWIEQNGIYIDPEIIWYIGPVYICDTTSSSKMVRTYKFNIHYDIKTSEECIEIGDFDLKEKACQYQYKLAQQIINYKRRK